MLGLPTDGWLLDAGGGTGRVSSQLNHKLEKLVLLDLSFPMLAEARTKNIDSLAQGYSHRLPFPNEYFDRILVVDALHHFHHQTAVIAELVRVLKPGGRLVVEEPDTRFLAVKLIVLMEFIMLMKSRFLKPAEIQAMMSSQGLDTRVETDNQFTAWVVGEKAPD